MCSHVEGVLGDKLKGIVDGPIGWKKIGEVCIGYHLSQYFQSPQYIPARRTTQVNIGREGWSMGAG